MASKLFGAAANASRRILTRTAGKPAPAPNPAAVVSAVLQTLGPLGKFITQIIAGPGQTLRREAEAKAAQQVLEALNRNRYDREAREAEARIKRELEDTPLPPEVQPQPQPRPQTQPARTPPPGEPPAPPSAPAPAPGGYDDIQLLGRGAFYYEDDITELVSREHRTPGSSNVYSYMWEHETPKIGILYVTFKAWWPEMKGRSDSPGPTYAYYDVPTRVYQQFRTAAADSAGGAVWDYLRQRGSVHGHQYQYRIVAGTLVQDGGVYVPRKATRAGFKSRAVTNVGAGRRGFLRSSLPEQNFLPNRGSPNRGVPDRGRPGA